MAAWRRTLMGKARLRVATLSLDTPSGEEVLRPSFALLMASSRAALALGSIWTVPAGFAAPQS